MARIDSRDGTPMLLFEGARTNYHVTSRDLGSYTDVGTPVLTDNTDGAPDGDATSRRVDLLSGEAHYKGTTGLTAAAPYVYSQWQRGISGQTTRRLFASGSMRPTRPSRRTRRRLRGEGRCSTGARPGTGQNNMAQEGRATNTLSPSGIVAGDRDGMFAFPQVEGGSVATAQFPTSVIRTTGSLVTRATDRLSFTGGNWPRGIMSSGIEIVFKPIPSSAEIAAGSSTMYLFSFKSGSTERVSFVGTGGNVFFSVAANNVNVISQLVTWAAGAELSVVLRPNANTATLSGFLTGNGTYTGGATWASFWQASYDANDNLHTGTGVTGVNAMFGRFAQRWRVL